VVDLRPGSRAARRLEVQHRGRGTGAEESRVGAAVEFEARQSGAGDGAEVEGATYIVRGYAVDKYLIGRGVAAAHKERSDAAILAGLDHGDTGRQAQGIHYTDRC